MSNVILTVISTLIVIMFMLFTYLMSSNRGSQSSEVSMYSIYLAITSITGKGLSQLALCVCYIYLLIIISMHPSYFKSSSQSTVSAHESPAFQSASVYFTSIMLCGLVVWMLASLPSRYLQMGVYMMYLGNILMIMTCVAVLLNVKYYVTDGFQNEEFNAAPPSFRLLNFMSGPSSSSSLSFSPLSSAVSPFKH
jgi:hypothetical protein